MKKSVKSLDSGMASAGERVQKLSAEAFSRLRNDHEQFLEAYEKPTQIYRFLHARRSFKSLFMHRNLSYMHHHKERRKKRTNRLRIGDLLKYRKHRQVEGKDLASQIKSDNFLKITFHDLEKGIDFSQLLSSALTGDAKSESPSSHTPCLMEVEVLLYSCHQHVSEAVSLPCSSISLGKFEVEYTPSKEGKVSGRGGSGTSHTLTIPESKLVWQGTRNRASGSLMLVFHARASVTNCGHPQLKKTPLLSPSSGVLHHQPQLANVSVEVNRINHSDLAQLARARQNSTTDMESSGSSAVDSLSSSGKQMRGSALPGCGSECDSHTVSLTGSAPTHTKAQRKTRSSKGRERRDACIMTDLTLGTGAATAPPVPPLSASTLPNSNPPCDQNPTSRDNSTTPPLLPKKGFTETGASLVRKLVVAQSARNGLNGLNFLNGYPEDHHYHPTESLPGHNHNGKPFPDPKTLSNYSLTVSIPCTTAYQNGSHSSTSTSTNTDISNSCSDTQQQPSPPLLPGKRRYKIPAQKCPEMQLLLEGEEPPDQQFNSEDVAVFAAEEPVSQTAQKQPQQQPKLSWMQLGAGNRRVIPVTASPLPGLVGTKNTSITGVKRNLSESDVAVEPDLHPAPPPPKIARVSETVTVEVLEQSHDGAARDVEMNISGLDTSETQMETTSTLTPAPKPTPASHNAPTVDHELQNGNSTSGPNSRIKTETPASAGVPPEGLFCAEMVVFDSRGECLLDEGDYSILMQKCPEKGDSGTEEGPPRLFTFSPLSWTSVFGAGDQEKVEESESMMLKFSLSWSRGPPKHRLLSELETALDLQRIRNDYFAPSPSRSQDSPKAAPPTVSSSLHGAEGMVESGTAAPPAPSEQPHAVPSQDTGTLLPSDPGSSMEQGEGEKECPAGSKEGVTGVTGAEEGSEKEEEGSADRDSGKSSSKEDLDEYFTATEASASSSVADSTELAHSSLPPHTASGTAIADQERGREERGRDRILYNFLYNSNSLQQTESRGDMQCPWCCLSCHHLYSLLKHMSLCHPRFLFTYTVRDYNHWILPYWVPMQQGGSMIDVHVNKLYEAGQTSMDQDPVERSGISLRQRWRGPLKCLPCTAVLVERHEGLEEDLSEFLNDGSWKRGYNVKRQFYHSGTCLPMVPEEMDADSEAEQDSISRWQKICSQKMIDEFTDVNVGEKEMMKLWNLFAMEHGMIADKSIPTACVEFAREKGSEIVQKNHVNSFLAHLVNLCQFGLISLPVIKTSMDILNARRSCS